MAIKADIVSGTNRTFKFTIQNMKDVMVYDTQYGIYIKANKLDSWAILQGDSSTINTGRLTLTRNTSSPSGNIPIDGTNVEIARFDVKATGEDVKITGMSLAALSGNGLYQGQIIFDNSQVGTVTNLASSSATSFSFGNTFIVPADGATHTLLIKADIKKADGTSYTSAGQTFTPTISSVTAIGRVSSAAVSASTPAGYQLTIATGNLSVAKNQAVPDWSSVNPTAVAGATEVLVGSFVVSSGASEGANINAIKITDYNGLFTDLQNVKLYNGTKTSGTQVGQTQSSVASGTSYTFYPSPYITLAKNSQFTLSVYADVKSSTSSSNGAIVVSTVYGTGVTTGSSVNYMTAVTGQTNYPSSAATLAIVKPNSSPATAQILAGTTGVEFTKAQFTGGKGEAISVTQLVVTATLGDSAQTSSISNISLWDGTTQVGSTMASLNSQGKATFDLSVNPWTVGIDEVKNLSIKANVSAVPNATSGGSIALGFAAGAVTYKGAVSGTTATGSAAAVTGSTMYVYKTKLTFATNSSSPSGAKGYSQTQPVMVFTVHNDGLYTAYLNTVKFTITHINSAGGYSSTSAAKNVYLYDYTNSDYNTLVATATIPIGTTYNSANATTVVDAATYANGYSIDAGETRYFMLVADTRDMAYGTSNYTSYLTFNVNLASDVSWDDGLSASVTTNTKTFPIQGGNLSYPH
jgi:hypothetical protein